MTEWTRHAQLFLHFQSSQTKSECLTMRGRFRLSFRSIKFNFPRNKIIEFVCLFVCYGDGLGKRTAKFRLVIRQLPAHAF